VGGQSAVDSRWPVTLQGSAGMNVSHLPRSQ